VRSLGSLEMLHRLLISRPDITGGGGNRGAKISERVARMPKPCLKFMLFCYNIACVCSHVSTGQELCTFLSST